jgi:hypothetical protein
MDNPEITISSFFMAEDFFLWGIIKVLLLFWDLMGLFNMF